MNGPNTAELVAVYEHILTNPEEWEQGVWGARTSCGTAFCVAGHAAIRAGGKPLWEKDDYYHESLYAVAVDGKPRRTFDFAREVLGLTQEQADVLFDGANTMEDLRLIILDFTGVDPESPAIPSQREGGGEE